MSNVPLKHRNFSRTKGHVTAYGTQSGITIILYQNPVISQAIYYAPEY